MTFVRRALAAAVPESLAVRNDGPTHSSPTFAETYDGYFSFAWRSARRLGTPQADMDDVLAIVVNVVRAHRRGLRARHPHLLSSDGAEEPDALPDGGAGPHERATRSEAARLVERFLDAMDDHRREVFVLAELEQLTSPEISAALGVPLNTVYSRLRSARRAFASAAARHRAREQQRDHRRTQ